MTDDVFKACLWLAAVLFTIIFCLLIIPPLTENPDIIGAFTAGMVNPFAAGYSTDVFFCWLVLAVWIWCEASCLAVKHGWVCLVLGVVPGVTAGFSLYLLVRYSQVPTRSPE